MLETGKSPCRNICILDARGEICTGCGRSLADIATWASLSLAERMAANRRAGERLAVVAPAHPRHP